MMDSRYEHCDNAGLTKQLSRLYHSIYVYVSVFAIVLGILLYLIRQLIYRVVMSWERIASLYAFASLVALMFSLGCYYSFLVCRLMVAQYRLECLMEERSRFLNDFIQVEHNQLNCTQ